MNRIRKILIANRGEIAVRIIKTAKQLGYATVAVYSEADRGALHVQQADESVCIGPASVTESYLNAQSILNAACISGANAIHPGYGFLSENSEFASLCLQQGLIFIGPSAEAIELMGSKRLSKIAVQQAGVPTVPGYDGEDQSVETLVQQAEAIGTPLMIKASAGGGGRGMRLVHDLKHTRQQLESARSEAANAFGSGELVLEKAIINPRHIEIQIFADQHGNIVSLGERDCSVQRRHQKVIEESPSPAVDDDLRHRISQSAIEVARLCDYTGAGTVEFLLDESGEFYFLEMNTRLQVEHPVTELVTGLDLVEWQIRVANGETLPLRQEQIELRGHAIEVRLYAEDPDNQYMPQSGRIHFWKASSSPSVRTDSGINSGSEVSPFYDPMLAKIIGHGQDRESALQALGSGLLDTALLGPVTNRTYLLQLIRHPLFHTGKATTAFIEQIQSRPEPHPETLWAIATGLWMKQGADPFSAERLVSTMGNTLILSRDSSSEKRQEVRCHARWVSGNALTIDIQGSKHHLSFKSISENRFTCTINDLTLSGCFAIEDDTLFIQQGDFNLILRNCTHQAATKTESTGSGRILSPMNGNLVALMVSEGDKVGKGDVLATVEAMKMEHALKSDLEGTVQSIDAKVGDQLRSRQLILLISGENSGH